MFRKVKYMVVVGAVAAGLTGCGDLLDTEPRQSVSPEVALANVAGIEGIVNSGYGRLQGQSAYGQRLQIVPDVLADNTVQGPTPSGRLQSELRFEAFNGVGSQGFYSNMYSLVNEMNYVIEAMPTLDAPEAQRNRLEGEARFLRALAYHNLAKVYAYEPGREVGGWTQGVILRTEAVRDQAAADLRTRASVSEVYALMRDDLQQAVTLLAGATNRTRATPAGAQALLARIELFASQWAQAEARATATLAATAATLVGETGDAAARQTAVQNMFRLAVNPEAIFQISVRPTESLGRNESLSALTRPAPAGAGHWGDVIPSPELRGLFEANDFRQSWFESYTARNAQGAVQWTAIFSMKYSGWQDTPAQSGHTDHIPVIRYSEVLLIRAEARAEQNNVEGALQDLNRLRGARNASALAGLNRGEVLAAIADERRRELHFEGHRFFDLKRRGQDVTKAAGTGGNVQFTDRRMLMPIPQREIDLNPNLSQNPGY